MDTETGRDKDELKNHSEGETEENFLITTNGDNEAVLDQEDKHSDSGQVTEESSAEEAATRDSENKLCTYHETAAVQQEEEEAEEERPIAACAHEVEIKYQEYRQLLLERDRARHESRQLQMKLAQYFKKTEDSAQAESEKPVAGQYEGYVKTLTELKQRLSAEAAQPPAEELRSQGQERLDKVETEWQTLMALKQATALTMLGGSLSKEVAQAKVAAFLQAEQLRQDELIKLRVNHIKLKMKVCRLEAELRRGEERYRDPLQVQFEQLQAEKLERFKRAEKKNEESLKLQKKICSSLEFLSNIKEKVNWNEMEIKAKREQLKDLETMLARKRALLTKVKQEKSHLLRHNLRLKERRGLLGNRVLLQDFEDTVDASEHLEEQLENLKCHQAEILSSCGRWRRSNINE